MNETETVKDLLLLAMSAEENAQAFYAELSRMFTHMPDVSARWKELMNDEVLHKDRLEKIFRQLSEEELSAPAPDILQKLRRTLRGNSLEDKLSSVETLDDAYEIAYWLEYSEVNIAFEVILSRFVTSEEKKDFVMDLISEHVAKLHGFGNIEWRQDIKAEK
jgi:rubrerythrin